MTKTTAYLLTATAVVLWGGAAGLFTKDLLAAGVGALEIAFWRLLLSGIIFIVHALLQKKLHVQKTRDLWHFALFAVFVIGLHYLSFSAAIEVGGLSLVNIVLATVPAMILLAAWFLFRERLTLRTLALLPFVTLVLNRFTSGLICSCSRSCRVISRIRFIRQGLTILKLLRRHC